MIHRSDTPETHGNLDACLAVSDRGRRRTRTLLMNQSTPDDALIDALFDAVRLFEALGIDYALVGGLAAMYYGRSRYTEDVDFIAATDHEALLASNPEAMQEHGFDPSSSWKLCHKSGIEIDIWKDEHVAAMVTRARPIQLASRPVKIIDPHDLIAMKLRADRPQDDYDIAQILENAEIDLAAMHELITEEQLARLQTIQRRIKGH